MADVCGIGFGGLAACRQDPDRNDQESAEGSFRYRKKGET